MPLLKIGGWVFTKIRKSKSQKFPYHLHHATISRFNQPHPTISLTSFLTNHHPQITLHFHPTHHKYSPHHHSILTPNLPNLPPQKYHPYPLGFHPNPLSISPNVPQSQFFMCSFLTHSNHFLIFQQMKLNKVIHIVFHRMLISYPQSLINLISKWIIIAVYNSLKCSYFSHFKAQVKRNIPIKVP